MTSAFLSADMPVAPPDLIARARACATPRVAIAAAGAEIPMQAAFEATHLGIMSPVFAGDSAKIHRLAAALNWDISDFEIIEAADHEAAATAAAMACGQGRADILMKGDVHSDMFLKAALQRDAGLRTGARLVHIFQLTAPHGGKPLLISDAAVNVTPDFETRQTATREIVSLAHKLGIAKPKVAFLSATETPIASVPSSVDARILRDWARLEITGADFSGPLALDLVLSARAAAIKGLDDDAVAGRADAVIVPDIVSGNVLFKALVYLAGGCAAGVITGAKVPMLLTSRADPPAARIASVALAAVAAAHINTPTR